ncbi:YagK/YfjJ domain-containing protein [Vibrio natriegens]|uniref:YagK/YfjJ domain-containing protein n=1 Tax=Vibrio natriegens TaxID=691 RepID=UPI001FB95533|nr:inovirus-type Gp2 protein [Vibrio natriegens]
MRDRIRLHPKKSKLAIYRHSEQDYYIFHRPTGVNQNILQSSFDLAKNWMGHYSKFCAVMLQLHQHKPSEKNQQLSIFLAKLTQALKKHYNTPNVGYFWVREHSNRDKQHYHLAVFISGHCCQHSGTIDRLANTLWKQQDECNFSYQVKNRIYKVKRYGFDKEWLSLLTRLSYFAKNDTKSRHPSRNSYGRSQLLKHAKTATSYKRS